MSSKSSKSSKPSKLSKSVKPAPKKTPAKPAKSSAKPIAKHTVKPAPKKTAASTKPAPAAKKTPAPPPAAKATAPAETSARASLRSRILAQSRAKSRPRPVTFSFDDAKAAASAAEKAEAASKSSVTTKQPGKNTKVLAVAKAPLRAATPNHVKAASLADILGFNPRKAAAPTESADDIPEKFRRYYRLLIDLRRHLTGQIDQHTEDTLKRSSKDDAGDLSSYGQHMADAGTDTFDRDFALSMVANEQEALSEVEAAIQRIKAGTYGNCEVTQKPIAKERLLAVPFTRYSAEALKQIEKNRLRTRTQAGLGSEMEDGGSMGGDDSGGE